MKLDQRYRDLYEMAHNETYSDEIRSVARDQLNDYIASLAHEANQKKHLDTQAFISINTPKPAPVERKITIHAKIEAGALLRNSLKKNLLYNLKKIKGIDNSIQINITESRSLFSSIFEIAIKNIPENLGNSIEAWLKKYDT